MNERQLFWLFILFAAAITLLRVVSVGGYPLYADEAQYWFWAQNPSFGYYSKPPMVAWAIAATKSVCGDGEGCIRLASPLAYFVSSFIIYAIGRRLFDSATGLLAAILFITMPAVALSAMLISTDPFLLLFWAAAIYFYLSANTKGLGIAAGLGLLSKYNFAFLLPSILLDAYWKNRLVILRQKWIYIAGAIALMLFLPNIYWNYSHDWVSFRHTEDIAQVGDNAAWNPLELLEFIAVQAAMLNPVLLAILLWALLVHKNFRQSAAVKTIASFILPMLAAILIISFRTRAHGNWAAPIHVGLVVLAAAAIRQYGLKKLAAAVLAINIIIAAAIVRFDDVAAIAGLPEKLNPLSRMQGWDEAGKKVAEILRANPDARLLTDRRKITAALMYYARPESQSGAQWNFYDIPRDHFAMISNLDASIGQNFIMIMPPPANEDIVKNFYSAEFLETIKITPDLELEAWRLNKFRGKEKP